MAYYKTCPYCESNLDSCEKCDCERAVADVGMHRLTRIEKHTKQITFDFKKEAWNEKVSCY